MDKEKQKMPEIQETLGEKAMRAIGTSFLVSLGLIIFFVIFLAFFIKGTIEGWF